MKDFNNWVTWLRSHYKIELPFSEEELLEAYNEHYPCNCETCVFRKEHGLVPRPLHTNCQAPLDGLDTLDDIAKLLKA